MSCTKRPIQYREIAPPSSLSGLVLCRWELQAASELAEVYRHHVVPDGCVSLIHRRPSSTSPGTLRIMGPRIQERRVDLCAGDAYCGVRLWPDAVGPLLGLRPVALFDRVDTLAEHAPALAAELEADLATCDGLGAAGDALIEGLSRLAAAAPEPDPVVRRAVGLIVVSEGRAPIAEVADRLGLSERQLQRRFREAVGLTPKQFARVRRLRESLAAAVGECPPSWVRLAAASGFADQAHLAREVARLTGLPPGAFRDHHRRIDLEGVDP